MLLSSLTRQGEPSCISSHLPGADPGKGHPAKVNPGDVVKDAHMVHSRSQAWGEVAFSRRCNKLLN